MIGISIWLYLLLKKDAFVVVTNIIGVPVTIKVDDEWKDEFEDSSSAEFSALNAKISNNVNNILRN